VGAGMCIRDSRQVVGVRPCPCEVVHAEWHSRLLSSLPDSSQGLLTAEWWGRHAMLNAGGRLRHRVTTRPWTRLEAGRHPARHRPIVVHRPTGWKGRCGSAPDCSPSAIRLWRNRAVKLDTELVIRAMEESAAIGKCVLVGRGGQCILRQREDVFHVFVYAPRQHRLRRVLPEVSNEAEARSRMDQIDQQRLAYIQRYFESDWDDRRLYQLMLNSRLGEEAASAVVTSAMHTAGDRLKV